MPTTKEFRDALLLRLRVAELGGARYLDVNAGLLHREIGDYPGREHRMASCCNVMHAEATTGDEVIVGPAKGKRASLTIRYALPRRSLGNIPVDQGTRGATAVVGGDGAEIAGGRNISPHSDIAEAFNTNSGRTRMTDIHSHHTATAVIAAPPFSRISWGSIIAGTICAFALQLLLNMVGLAVGFAAIDPAQQSDPLSGVATGTGIWWGVSALISLFIGGWVAARLSGVPITTTAALHGVSVWALSVLLAVWLATSAITSVASGVIGAVSQVGNVAASAMGGAASEDSPLGRIVGAALSEQRSTLDRTQTRLESIGQDIRSEAREVYREVVSPQQEQQAVDAAEQTAQDIVRSPGTIGQSLSNLVDRLFAADGVFTDEDRQEALEVLQNRLGITQQEAEQVVQNWQDRYQAAVQDIQQARDDLQQAALEAAQQATDVVAEASMWTAIALVLGLIAALLGGLVGRPAPWAIEAAEDNRS